MKCNANGQIALIVEAEIIDNFKTNKKNKFNKIYSFGNCLQGRSK